MTQAQKSDPLGRAVDFLASVKLSFFIFIILAVASIAGTIIPQKQAAQVYLNGYGQGTGNLILGLGLDDTYHAAWYIFLLAMLAVNLVICSLKRLPIALKIINKDPEQDLARFPKPGREEMIKAALPQARARAEAALKAKIGDCISQEAEDGVTLFAQKGAWSRLGVYVVHASVLIIFIGAIISNLWGINGTMIIHEGQTETTAELDDKSKFNLGFGVRLDKYTETYYEKFQNMPSEYRSDLVFVQNGKDMAKASVRVNHPHEYGGVTFYQSFRGQSPTELKVRMKRGQQTAETKLAFQKWGPLLPGRPAAGQGVMEYRDQISMGQRYKGPFARILFEDQEGKQHQLVAFAPGFQVPPSMVQKTVDLDFEILSAQVSWYTGLQVKKDPGVWVGLDRLRPDGAGLFHHLLLFPPQGVDQADP